MQKFQLAQSDAADNLLQTRIKHLQEKRACCCLIKKKSYCALSRLNSIHLRNQKNDNHFKESSSFFFADVAKG